MFPEHNAHVQTSQVHGSVDASEVDQPQAVHVRLAISLHGFLHRFQAARRMLHHLYVVKTYEMPQSCNALVPLNDDVRQSRY